MERKQSISLADRVFEQLEGEILSGRYETGTVLTELALSQALGVSRTPVREAVRRLEQEGLLVESGKGVRVVGVSKKDLEDIYEIRARIEGLAARRAAAYMQTAQLQKLQEVLDLQAFYTEKNDAAHIRNMDSAFHEAIYENCGSPVLRDMLSSLHRRVQRYRKESVTDAARAKCAAAEHRAILEAIASHDGALADRLSVQHIQNAKKHILDKE